MAVVMNPTTGEIFAMALRPSFNPNFFESSSPALWKNRVVTDTFEPGSTFKVFLIAAALDSGLVDIKDSFFCENGRVKVYDRYIHDSRKYGTLTVEDILKFSSNIGAYKIADRVGKSVFYRYIKDFGFGAKTGIGLPGEVPGSVRDIRRLSPIGVANIAFGQGISVTAIQLVGAISAVANGGRLMEPHIVKRVVDSEGVTVFESRPKVVRRVVSTKTAGIMTSMLKRVISGGGTGGRAAIDGYLVAGKTGTSQKYDAKAGGYSRDRHTSSFIGFFPADAPILSIVVLLDEPKQQYYGGRVAAPVFRRIAEQSLAYLKVAPINNRPVKRERQMVEMKRGGQEGHSKRSAGPGMPDLRGLTLREILVEMGTPPIQIKGSGVVIDQYPRPGDVYNKKKGYKVRLGA